MRSDASIPKELFQVKGGMPCQDIERAVVDRGGYNSGDRSAVGIGQTDFHPGMFPRLIRRLVRCNLHVDDTRDGGDRNVACGAPDASVGDRDSFDPDVRCVGFGNFKFEYGISPLQTDQMRGAAVVFFAPHKEENRSIGR